MVAGDDCQYSPISIAKWVKVATKEVGEAHSTVKRRDNRTRHQGRGFTLEALLKEAE